MYLTCQCFLILKSIIYYSFCFHHFYKSSPLFFIQDDTSFQTVHSHRSAYNLLDVKGGIFLQLGHLVSWLVSQIHLIDLPRLKHSNRLFVITFSSCSNRCDLLSSTPYPLTHICIIIDFPYNSVHRIIIEIIAFYAPHPTFFHESTARSIYCFGTPEFLAKQTKIHSNWPIFKIGLLPSFNNLVLTSA